MKKINMEWNKKIKEQITADILKQRELLEIITKVKCSVLVVPEIAVFNRLKEISKNIDSTLYDVFLDIIKGSPFESKTSILEGPNGLPSESKTETSKKVLRMTSYVVVTSLIIWSSLKK